MIMDGIDKKNVLYKVNNQCMIKTQDKRRPTMTKHIILKLLFISIHILLYTVLTLRMQ